MPNSEKVILLHYGELWLRGHNRSNYIKALRNNLINLLNGESYLLESQYDRIVLRLTPKSNTESMLSKLSYLFGISRYELAYETNADMNSILTVSKKLLIELKKTGATQVKIDAHRAFKGLAFNSLDIINKISDLARSVDLKPAMHNYNSMLFIRVTKENAYIFSSSSKGIGGLPVSTSGKGIVLFSGGIDSPVAAWYAMKRGVLPIYLHLHSYQNPNKIENTKIPKILSILSPYSSGMGQKIYYVPAHIFQISAFSVDKKRCYEPVLMKAFLLRLAEKIAKKEGAGIIYTGESLGQVSSQTVKNLAASQFGIKIPIARPLIGFDKEEIISVAKRINTYNESIKPYIDVCSTNVTKTNTSSDTKVITALLKKMRISELVKKSLKEAKIISNGQSY
ncbi:MAG: tRNA uracil 4-sulfurtransferase ThiI [Candidatus Micrarchaeia archaeon]